MICHARDNAKEAQEEFYCFLGKRITLLLSSKNTFNSIKNIAERSCGLQQNADDINGYHKCFIVVRLRSSLFILSNNTLKKFHMVVTRNLWRHI